MNILFFLHSLWRWVVLAVAIITIVKLAMGLIGRKSWSNTDNLLGLAFTTVFDIQLLLGLIVYAGTFMNLHPLRWYPTIARLSMEHVTLMILALVVVHVVWMRVKKQSTDSKKFRTGLIGFGVSLLMIAAAVPTWAMSVSA